MKHLPILFALSLFSCRGGEEEPVDTDLDGFVLADDCNDEDSAVNPDAVEICNGIDDNCDGIIDEDATDVSTFYADFDGDEYGNASVSVDACDAPDGYVSDATDCDDADADWHPGADETCEDPNDYNCDGSVGYADEDGDGFAACEECDDSQSSINPTAVELCDGIDNNCDGVVDEEGAFGGDTWYADADGDGFGDPSTADTSCTQPTGTVEDGTDCDDSAAAVNPSAVEICNDLDDDCDGVADDDASDASVWYADIDEDGAAGDQFTLTACEQPTGYLDSATDCDDLDPETSPSAVELCDGTDNNCDGAVPSDELDGDDDGFFGCEGDCADDDALRFPGTDELCNDVDDDCDGSVDEGAVDEETWFADIDGDGQGGVLAATACDQPGGYVDNAEDCNDLDAEVFSGAPEVCDGGDANCDGSVDNDADGDGFADSSCGGLDCDDADSAKNPDGDACSYPSCQDALDDGLTDDGFVLLDPDGQGTGADPFEVWCEQTFLGGGWLAIWNMAERPRNNASAAEMHNALIVFEDMAGAVLPDSSSAAVYSANLPLSDYTEVVYGWAPSTDDDVSAYGYGDRTGTGLADQAYVGQYPGTNVSIGSIDIEPTGNTRTIYTGNSPTYPHVGLGYSGQIIVWGYDNNASSYSNWANWYDGNPCCNAGNTSDISNAGWRYSILIR